RLRADRGRRHPDRPLRTDRRRRARRRRMGRSRIRRACPRRVRRGRVRMVRVDDALAAAFPGAGQRTVRMLETGWGTVAVGGAGGGPGAGRVLWRRGGVAAAAARVPRRRPVARGRPRPRGESELDRARARRHPRALGGDDLRRRYHGPVIARYSRPAMARVWSDEEKLARWLDVELAALAGWAAVGAVPVDGVGEIRDRATQPSPPRGAALAAR